MGEVKILKLKVLTGPNIWAYRPVIEMLTDIGKYEYLPSNKLPGFTESLSHLIPSLWDHRCSEVRPGGFLERLRLGTYMGHILEHVVLELQSLAGLDVGFGRTRQTPQRGIYRVVVDYKDPAAATTAAHTAIEIVESLAQGAPLGFSLAQRIEQIRAEAEDNMLGPSTLAIVTAARARGIPWFRLSKGSIVQLGHGRHAKRIQAAETSFTANIAVEIASDKDLTKDLLDKVGVPVPRGEVVYGADDAWRVALRLGGPVVVKPSDGNQGKAVSVNLESEEQVRTAFELAQEYSSGVIVEQFIPGRDHRLLVVGGRLLAAAERRPAQVVADGIHSVRDLVRMVNEDPRRGHGHGAALTRIRMDGTAELTLAKQGYTWDSVPPVGEPVLLRDNSNLSTGGTATDVTSEVHPDNAALAVLAARTIGLDIAGVDVVCENIHHPLSEQGGAVVEVNAAPGLRAHIYPSEGKSRPVGEAIVDMLFPDHTEGRVPIIAVTGTNGKTTVTRMIGHIFATTKAYVGMTTTDGIYFGGVQRVKGDCSGPRSAEAVLQHPMVDVAVLETARGGILRSGLAWDRSTVSVVLNVANDHLGLEGIETPERLARVKRVIVESVSPDGYGVLNADDPLVAGMTEYCTGKVIFFGLDPNARAMSAHLAAGGRGAFLHNGDLVLAEGSRETVLMPASDVPATYRGLVPFQVQNALAAAAACWGAGVPLDTVRLGLRTFQSDEVTAPGRFNVFTVGGANVIVDYGHNPHALRAIQAAIRKMEPRRAIGVVAAPGDRRDVDIQELATVAAHTFETVIVREEDDLRGRESMEVAGLIAETVQRSNPSVDLRIIRDEADAVDFALQQLEPGDVAVLFIDRIEDTIEQVKQAARTVEIQQSDAFFCPLPSGPLPSFQMEGEPVVDEPLQQGSAHLVRAPQPGAGAHGAIEPGESATATLLRPAQNGDGPAVPRRPRSNGKGSNGKSTSVVDRQGVLDGEPDGHS